MRLLEERRNRRNAELLRFLVVVALSPTQLVEHDLRYRPIRGKADVVKLNLVEPTPASLVGKVECVVPRIAIGGIAPASMRL